MCARDEAFRLGVRGWISNLADGRVETEFEGPADKVDHMVDWCRKGPDYAEVDNFDVEELPYKGDLAGFGIKR